MQTFSYSILLKGGRSSLSSMRTNPRGTISLHEVSFLVPFEVLMEEAVSPYVLISQKLTEPRAARTSGQDMLKKLQSFGVALDFLSVFLSVLCLLRQHIGVVDLSNYARAMFTWPALRPWRLLLPRLMPVIFDNKPSFGGCQLARPYESDPTNVTLGPHCQCGLRAKYMRGRGQEAAASNMMSWKLTLPVAAATGRRRPTQRSVTSA